MYSFVVGALLSCAVSTLGQQATSIKGETDRVTVNVDGASLEFVASNNCVDKSKVPTIDKSFIESSVDSSIAAGVNNLVKTADWQTVADSKMKESDTVTIRSTLKAASMSTMDQQMDNLTATWGQVWDTYSQQFEQDITAGSNVRSIRVDGDCHFQDGEYFCRSGNSTSQIRLYGSGLGYFTDIYTLRFIASDGQVVSIQGRTYSSNDDNHYIYATLPTFTHDDNDAEFTVTMEVYENLLKLPFTPTKINFYNDGPTIFDNRMSNETDYQVAGAFSQLKNNIYVPMQMYYEDLVDEPADLKVTFTDLTGGKLDTSKFSINAKQKLKLYFDKTFIDGFVAGSTKNMKLAFRMTVEDTHGAKTSRDFEFKIWLKLPTWNQAGNSIKFNEDNLEKILVRAGKPADATLKMCYSMKPGTQIDTTTMHTNCDNKGAYLFIIKRKTSDTVSGGYYPQSLVQGCGYLYNIGRSGDVSPGQSAADRIWAFRQEDSDADVEFAYQKNNLYYSSYRCGTSYSHVLGYFDNYCTRSTCYCNIGNNYNYGLRTASSSNPEDTWCWGDNRYLYARDIEFYEVYTM